MTVEYECGFSIYPPLPPTPSNQSLYALFLARLRTTFSSQLHPFTSRLLLIADADAAFYYFTLPKFPKIPANHEHCNYFLSFRLSFGDGGLPREVTVAHVLEVLVIAKECFGESVRYGMGCIGCGVISSGGIIHLEMLRRRRRRSGSYAGVWTSRLQRWRRWWKHWRKVMSWKLDL
ncbi:hypothetical protein FVER14953_09814 [Fusarium verticillioides]|nr:hypothetical protein FVER14953_09814 [Fusarium verticillioides]